MLDLLNKIYEGEAKFYVLNCLGQEHTFNRSSDSLFRP